MAIALITGSSGLVGSEATNFFHDKGFDVIGIDNNLRKFFFGKNGSTLWVKTKLIERNKNYKHFNIDIRNKDRECSIQNIYNFSKMKCDIYIDKIWKYNEKYVCKWKVKKILIV